MPAVERREQLLDQILRLRRINRRLPGDEDVATIRIALERELGPTVSFRIAGRLLGVSHTALLRWIESGDLPVVETPRGRRAVPVPALLDLLERLDREDAEGHDRYRLTSTMQGQRRAADALKLTDHSGTDGPDTGHDRARRRALAYHEVIARRLRRAIVDEARHVVMRWRADGRIDPRYADRWLHLLDRPLGEIRRAIVDTGTEADDLRQNSPFAGMLSEPERQRILQEIT